MATAAAHIHRTPIVDRAHAWARRVVDGDEIACQWVRLACQRQFDDLERGHERGLYWDSFEAERSCRFYDLNPHVKGPLTTREAVRANNQVRVRNGERPLRYCPIELSDWQAFAVSCLYGWRRLTDNAQTMFFANPDDPTTWPRRFTKGHLCVGRKNGKSTFVAPLCNKSLCADSEGGAEIFSAATTRDQAKIIWKMANAMVRKGPLKSKLKIKAGHTEHLASDSEFKPLSADYDTLDGLNNFFSAIDELHAHKDRGLYEVIDSSHGSRASQLIVSITTAGVDRESVCYEIEVMIKQILQGVIEDDTVFGLLFTVDDDDLKDEEALLDECDAWYKANPNMGISVSIDTLKSEAAQAKESPRKRANFLRKRLNVWVGADSAWLNMSKWAACPDSMPLAKMDGRTCFAGLDLATKKDLACLVLLFDYYGTWQPYVFSWIPAGALEHFSKQQQLMFRDWEKRGILTINEGDTLDQDLIIEFLNGDPDGDGEAKKGARHRYDIATLAYDPWHASKLIQDLIKGNWPEDRVVEVGQTAKHLSEPMKTVEAWILDKTMANPRNPLLTWCLSNIVCHEDKASNIKPNRETKANKIDAGVALITATSRALFTQPAQPSVYETRGMRQL